MQDRQEEQGTSSSSSSMLLSTLNHQHPTATTTTASTEANMDHEEADNHRNKHGNVPILKSLNQDQHEIVLNDNLKNNNNHDNGDDSFRNDRGVKDSSSFTQHESEHPNDNPNAWKEENNDSNNEKPAAYYGVAKMPSQNNINNDDNDNDIHGVHDDDTLHHARWSCNTTPPPTTTTTTATTTTPPPISSGSILRSSYNSSNNKNSNDDSTINEKNRWSTATNSTCASSSSSLPGSAVYVSGLGPGCMPSWALQRLKQQQEQRLEESQEINDNSSSNSNSDNDYNDDSINKVIEAVVVDEEAMERSFVRRISDTVTSVVVIEEEDEEQQRKRKRRRICMSIILALACLCIGLAIGLRTTQKDEATTVTNTIYVTSSPSTTPSSVPTAMKLPTLQTIQERKHMNCGTAQEKYGFHETVNNSTGEVKGFHVDLCRAIAAAVFGEDYNDQIEYIETTTSLGAIQNLTANASLDLVVRGITVTMERDIFVESVGAGFSFTSPYLYDGIVFAGKPDFVDCADNLDAHGDVCANLRICVCEDCTHHKILRRKWFPSDRLVPTDDRYQLFANGECNVIAHERPFVAKRVLDKEIPNYAGEYKVGTNLFSKEPLAIVTRDDDVEWSTFCDWVLQALLAAEKYNITQETADNFLKTNTTPNAMGDEFASSRFVNVIKAVGNYGEIYNRNLQDLVPRQGLDGINTKGDTGLIYSIPFGDTLGIGPDPTSKDLLGVILKRKHIVCGIVVQARLDVYNSTNQVWSGINADFCRAVSAGIFDGNTTLVEFVEVDDSKDGFAALSNGTLDLLSGATVTFETNSVAGISFSPPYFYSNDDVNEAPPIALATRQTDLQWSSFVRWVVFGTFFAEENGITDTTFVYMPDVKLLGNNFTSMFQDIIREVGNYGQIYERNVQNLHPRNGSRNMLNKIPYGPQHFPLLTMNL